MNSHHLNKYLTDHFTTVEGFCPTSALYVLDHHSSLFSKEVSVMEIGVHHGQFFIGLNQFATERSYAIDVFDSQELNIDNSGQGNYQKFLHNLQNHDPRHKGSNVAIITGDSLDRNTFSAVLNECDVISVDGGHTPIHVVNDLKTASNLIKTTGVVIVDDYFNHWWPTVTEGIVKYLGSNPVLVPFCTSQNKMWMCSISYRDRYINHMEQIGHNFGKTITSFYGHRLIDLW
jgi:hypothetical protein